MPPIQFSVRRNGNMSIVSLGGKLDAINAPGVDGKLAEEIDKGCSILVLNMERVDYLSSAGAGVLININEQLRKKKGELRLCHLPAEIMSILKMLGFAPLFSIFPDENAAVKS